MSQPLPDGWIAGEFVDYEDCYGDPPVSADPALMILFGMAADDDGHRLYEIPIETPISMIVNYFRIGTHNCGHERYEPPILEAVANNAALIHAAVPCRPIFADAAGLKLKFLHQITDAEIHELMAILNNRDGNWRPDVCGLDIYLDELYEQDFLPTVKKQNLFHFWWD